MSRPWHRWTGAQYRWASVVLLFAIAVCMASEGDLGESAQDLQGSGGANGGGSHEQASGASTGDKGAGIKLPYLEGEDKPTWTYPKPSIAFVEKAHKTERSYISENVQLAQRRERNFRREVREHEVKEVADKMTVKLKKDKKAEEQRIKVLGKKHRAHDRAKRVERLLNKKVDQDQEANARSEEREAKTASNLQNVLKSVASIKNGEGADAEASRPLAQAIMAHIRIAAAYSDKRLVGLNEKLQGNICIEQLRRAVERATGDTTRENLERARYQIRQTTECIQKEKEQKIKESDQTFEEEQAELTEKHKLSVTWAQKIKQVKHLTAVEKDGKANDNMYYNLKVPEARNKIKVLPPVWKEHRLKWVAKQKRITKRLWNQGEVKVMNMKAHEKVTKAYPVAIARTRANICEHLKEWEVEAMEARNKAMGEMSAARKKMIRAYKDADAAGANVELGEGEGGGDDNSEISYRSAGQSCAHTDPQKFVWVEDIDEPECRKQCNDNDCGGFEMMHSRRMCHFVSAVKKMSNKKGPAGCTVQYKVLSKEFSQEVQKAEAEFGEDVTAPMFPNATSASEELSEANENELRMSALRQPVALCRFQNNAADVAAGEPKFFVTRALTLEATSQFGCHTPQQLPGVPKFGASWVPVMQYKPEGEQTWHNISSKSTQLLSRAGTYLDGSQPPANVQLLLQMLQKQPVQPQKFVVSRRLLAKVKPVVGAQVAGAAVAFGPLGVIGVGAYYAISGMIKGEKEKDAKIKEKSHKLGGGELKRKQELRQKEGAEANGEVGHKSEMKRKANSESRDIAERDEKTKNMHAMADENSRAMESMQKSMTNEKFHKDRVAEARRVAKHKSGALEERNIKMADADTAARHCSKALFRRRRTCACDDKDTTPAQQEKFRKKLASKQHAKTLAKHTRFQKELDQKVKESKAKPAYHRKGRRLLDADHSTELNCERLLGEGWSKPVPPSVAMPTIHGISTASGTPRKGRTLLARAGQSGSANTAGTCLRLLGEGWDSQPAGRSLLNTEISATTVQETCSGEERLGLEKLLREADEFQASFRTELMSNEQAAEESTEFGEDDADMDDTGDNYNGFSTFSTFAKQDIATSPQQQGRKLLGAQHEQKLGEGNAPRDTKAINTFDRRRRTADYERRRYVRRRASKQDRRRSNLPVTKDVRIPSLVCPCPPPGPDSEPDYLPTMAPAPPLGPPAGSARRRMVTKSRRRAPVVTEYDNEAICKREKYCKVQACQSARGGKSGKGGRGVGGGRKGT